MAESGGVDDKAAAKRISVPWLIYQQVASIFAALSLVLLLEHFVQIDWHGIFANILAAWANVIRPATQFVLDWTILPVLHWLLRWPWELPAWLSDYFSVGVVSFFSYARITWKRVSATEAFDISLLLGLVVLLPFYLLLSVLAWPLVAYILIFRRDKTSSFSNLDILLMYSPLMYVVVILAANFALGLLG
jgi:hypothetical protein